MKLYQAKFKIKESDIPKIEMLFEDVALSFADVELIENDDIREMRILANELLDFTNISYISDIYKEEIISKDWVSEVQKSFPILNIDNFLIIGSHHNITPKPHQIPLYIDAGAAFGTGEHSTTSTCLRAISIIYKLSPDILNKTLDMGCGSGILAMAVAKLNKKPVYAVDIDPVSVQVTNVNAKNNQLSNLIKTECADGYNSNLVRKNAKFSCVISNILAKPLVKFAPSLAKNIAPNGIVILSGLLATQEKMVLSAHRLQGFRLLARLEDKGWSCLILQR